MKTGSRRLVKGVVLVAIICFAAFALVACGQQEEKVVEKEVIKEVVKEVPKELKPLKLAVAGAHTGDLASYGIPSVRAAEILVEHVNSMNGVGGRKVILITEDDACKPEMATNAATKVVGEDVDLVMGHICSGATKSALGIYKDSGIIAISPSATNPDLTQTGDYPNFFRTIASDDAQARLEVDFALNTLGLTKIAVLHDKGDYGKGLAEFAKKFLEESGKAEVVLFEGITPRRHGLFRCGAENQALRGPGCYFRRIPSRSV